MGDPGGVGPEVVIMALGQPEISGLLAPLLVGDLATWRAAAVLAGADPARLVEVPDPDDAVLDFGLSQSRPEAGRWPVWCPGGARRPDGGFAMGTLSAGNGRAAHACIVGAARLALAGRIDAVCTAPIAKEAMYAAGFEFPGHTEILADVCGGVPVRMMLEGGGLRAVLQTIHVPLASVPGLLTAESILETLRIAGAWFARHADGGRPARIAVCGLNPHAGEGGHFGREEIDIIVPAINAARAAGIDATGPWPGDTVFHRALQGEFDAVVAMYHDQALIPVKTLDFHGGVNITLGLPIVRTSPDHGTAFDLAGTGRADPRSMMAALRRAAELGLGVTPESQ